MLEFPKPSLYFAAPLFSDAELAFNANAVERLERWFDVYLPQRDGGLLADLLSRGVALQAAYKSIFDRDITALRSCDICLIVLDGRTIDEGAAFEVGFAWANGKNCIGLQTDVRRLLPAGNNPMIQCSLSEIFRNLDELCLWASRDSIQSDRHLSSF